MPTLKLWSYEAAKAKDAGMARHFGQVSRQQVAAFRKAGGRILFGTDVGYMSDFDPTEEYAQLAESGVGASATRSSRAAIVSPVIARMKPPLA